VSDPTQAASGTGAAAIAGLPAQRWLAAMRSAVEAHREIFAAHRGIEGRTRYDGIGEGGDRTLVIDRLCEDAVFRELEGLHREGSEFVAIAEERGEVTFGERPSARVVIDPIDGSLNARRTVPCHSLSVAVAEGASMEEVVLGYVYEFGAGEEFFAVRGEGATLDGEPISVAGGDGLEIVAMEATRPERLVPVAESLSGKVYRIRTPGSIAVSLVYVAAGRFDGMMTTRECRSVDAAAGQLVVSEAGGLLRFDSRRLSETPFDLSARYHLAAARTAADLETLLAAQRTLR
jgi:myo-inositol-1(or 4)-monophosphatase